ncbi:MAG: hypothetical protein JWN99_1866, partial [Ilumatobacteraceae bacterium]|nr:hypothetical protein [Ilumatobacteraceae bacterium]
TDVPIEPCFSVHRHLDHALIRLNGDFDVDQSEALELLADTLFSEFTATVEVDMVDVTFFGSRALAALLHLNNEVARHSGAEMRISGVSEPVHRLFEMTGVMDLLLFSTASARLSDVA